ncbi:hypothetical protein F2Q70_00026590 [Brassica cretica]|uniref:Uncharacterized protein n=1 Tax=Brassica cretica TaxID=69181 RepID=A0A8S9L617_BRACR|nr:hypothetical protein F2Q70_00026590 [Brassica cretica]
MDVRSLRSDRALARTRSLRSGRAEHVFGRCVAILFELLSDDSRFLHKAFRKEESISKNLGTTSPVLEGEEREKLWQVDGTLYLDQHQTGVITTTSYAGAGSSVGRCQPKILNIRFSRPFLSQVTETAPGILDFSLQWK